MTDEELLDLFLRMPIRIRDQQFIDTAKAAEIAGVTQRTIQIWIECRLIRAIRIRKRYRVNRDTLIDYLKRQLAGHRVPE